MRRSGLGSAAGRSSVCGATAVDGGTAGGGGGGGGSCSGDLRRGLGGGGSGALVSFGGQGTPAYMAPELLRGDCGWVLVGGGGPDDDDGTATGTATTATTTTTTGASGTTAGLPSPWEQADVYAFGVVVWALRFCERPWHECRSPYEIVRRVGMEGGRLPLDGVGADGAGVRGALRAVLAACLSPKPEQRPSFAALLTSLQQVPPEEWVAE